MSELKTIYKRARGLATTFVNALVPDYENKQEGVHLYGKNNLLPNEWLRCIADSGIATRAMNKLGEYIAADGFTKKKASVFMVNEIQTADQLLREQAVNMAGVTAAAFYISRKGGKVNAVKALPIQCVRKKMDGSFVYNETYGQPRLDKTKDKHYAAFKPGELSSFEMVDKKYKDGEILYVYRKTPFNTHYGIPDYYSQIEDVRTSSELAKFDLETVLNGFVTSIMITMLGDIDNATKDEAGKSDLDYVLEDFRQFTGQQKNHEGLSGRNKAWLNFARTREEAPVAQQFDTKSILEASNTKRDVIERAVARLFGVHPVLLGYSDATILGNTQALANASLELNKVADPYKALLSEAFATLWPEMDWTISEYMPITYIDPSLYDKMTEEEIRNKLLGLPPKETDTTGTGDKVLKALNSLSPVLLAKVLETLTPDEIRQLIGLEAAITPPQTPPVA